MYKSVPGLDRVYGSGSVQGSNKIGLGPSPKPAATEVKKQIEDKLIFSNDFVSNSTTSTCDRQQIVRETEFISTHRFLCLKKLEQKH